jgi:hypothetical protein
LARADGAGKREAKAVDHAGMEKDEANTSFKVSQIRQHLIIARILSRLRIEYWARLQIGIAIPTGFNNRLFI